MNAENISDMVGLDNLWKLENLYLAGQPTLENIKMLHEKGLRKIINIRGQAESDFSDQEKLCSELNIEYHHIPLLMDKQVQAESCKKINQLVDSETVTMIHCMSANRVGAWLITYLVENQKMGIEESAKVALESCLKSQGFCDEAVVISNILKSAN